MWLGVSITDNCRISVTQFKLFCRKRVGKDDSNAAPPPLQCQQFFSFSRSFFPPPSVFPLFFFAHRTVERCFSYPDRTICTLILMTTALFVLQLNRNNSRIFYEKICFIFVLIKKNNYSEPWGGMVHRFEWVTI